MRRRFFHRASVKSAHRAKLSGVAIGIGIGAIGATVVLLSRPRDEERILAPGNIEPSSKLLQHEALRYGCPSTNNIQVRSGYVVSYDYRTRNASWVMEYLTRDSLRVEEETERSKSHFMVDDTTPKPFRVHPNQFLKSGYDKGHLAPARDMATSQEAMNESFLMTNISPQIGVGFNRSYWSRFEGFIRHLAMQLDGVYVITGPLFLPKKNKQTGEYRVSYPVIGTPPDAISVPTHFFKVVLAKQRDGTFATAGFILPNKVIPDKKELTEFLAPVEVIEKYSGLLFFDKLSNVQKVNICDKTKCALAGTYRRAIQESNNK